MPVTKQIKCDVGGMTIKWIGLLKNFVQRVLIYSCSIRPKIFILNLFSSGLNKEVEVLLVRFIGDTKLGNNGTFEKELVIVLDCR